MEEMAPYVMEDIRPNFYKEITEGDIIVAGKNFGCGSSREAAPAVLKAAGISAVISPLFARIFYRNAINVGLPVITLESANKTFSAGETLEIDLELGKILKVDSGILTNFQPIPSFMMGILREGGLVPYIKKNKRFILSN
ncbi:3-isopropylmalate dehydratase [Anaerobacillus sp. CMMVII]|uniref:LeuD/DmdB family oxidoreductase small subunit n=1 Tax=Anaerobacillus sp. CMMVII TaxID=2755588 RepID=UPI0028E0A47C|nr:3-isopropylmalate dehydratase [Anaerobacillus sp. CMMVII]